MNRSVGMGENVELKGKRLNGYLSLSEASRELKLSKQWVHELIHEDRIAPVFHVDGFYLIPESTIKKFKNSPEIRKPGRPKGK